MTARSGDGWALPEEWARIVTIDAHTAGEPFRVVTAGLPAIPGATMLERRAWAAEHLEHLRTALMWEPRGHADMYGGFVTPPATPGADLGVLFLHNAGYSTMCGHGIIALTTVALEAGLVSAAAGGTRPLRIDTPAGPVDAEARRRDGRVEAVRFRNVPSFVLALDRRVRVAGLGRVPYDLAYGGAFYALVRAEEVGLSCTPRDFRPLIERGVAIKRAIVEQDEIAHPLEPALGFLYGVIFIETRETPGVHSRNVCVFADGEVDRSPTGTGVSARLAVHHARGEIADGQTLVVESMIGSRFSGRVVERTRCGPHAAVIPEIEGRAHITGRHEFVIDPADELRRGFLLR